MQWSVSWWHCALTGCVELGVTKTGLKMIEDRNCKRGGTPIAIPTTSWAEEGCTLAINGIIDTNEQAIVDRNGLLHQVTSDECTTEQRLGRGLRIFKGSSTPDAWVHSYSDLLKVELAAIGLSYGGQLD